MNDHCQTPEILDFLLYFHHRLLNQPYKRGRAKWEASGARHHSQHPTTRASPNIDSDQHLRPPPIRWLYLCNVRSLSFSISALGRDFWHWGGLCFNSMSSCLNVWCNHNTHNIVAHSTIKSYDLNSYLFFSAYVNFSHLCHKVYLLLLLKRCFMGWRGVK